MIEQIHTAMAQLTGRFSDRRTQLLDVRVSSFEGNDLQLAGRVLDDATHQALTQTLSDHFPMLHIDTGAVRVLRQALPCTLYVQTNLTSLHAAPSWLAEMLSQNTFGTALEMLDEHERWVLVRQSDGYLGWVYRPYLTEQPTPASTYIVSAPITPIYAEPDLKSQFRSRLVGGTEVQIVATRGSWAEVDANVWGWVHLADLCACDLLPKNTADRRRHMIESAARLTGVPYLWGGTSLHGIDCSGLAQLVHRWVGIPIPRDADQQYLAAQKIEPPYQPGDLLFFGENGDARQITHVAISLGDWRIIHSSRSHNGVYYDDVQEVEHLRTSFRGAATFLTA